MSNVITITDNDIEFEPMHGGENMMRRVCIRVDNKIVGYAYASVAGWAGHIVINGTIRNIATHAIANMHIAVDDAIYDV